jgi:hypothetical protein
MPADLYQQWLQQQEEEVATTMANGHNCSGTP